jgi:hypothetical protein
MKNILLLLVALCFALKTNGDSIPGNAFAKVQQEEIVQRKFDEAKWKQITKDIDYSNERKLTKSTPSKLKPGFNINPAVAKAVIFTLVISALAFLLYKIFGKNIFKRNPDVKTENLFSEEIINEETPLAGLEKLLSEAISKKSFREAIRIYYLVIIRRLSDHNLILWKKDKTNREYVFEMRAHPSFILFKEATYIFETAWYRNVNINYHDFISVQPKFENLIQSITFIKVNEQ